MAHLVAASAICRLTDGGATGARCSDVRDDCEKRDWAALRKAFYAKMADAGFLDIMKKRNVMLAPLTGEQADKISNDTLDTPKDVLALVQKLVKVK